MNRMKSYANVCVVFFRDSPIYSNIPRTSVSFVLFILFQRGCKKYYNTKKYFLEKNKRKNVRSCFFSFFQSIQS